LKHIAKPTLANQALDYPFGKRWCPEQGVPFEVADGVYWLRMPLPISLDHINLWLLKDEADSWTIVDTGYDAQICKDVWDRVFKEFFAPEKVKQIIVTHFHPDHIGLAAWLAHKCDVPVLISKGEFNHYNEIIQRDKKQFSKLALKFAVEIGFNTEIADTFATFFGRGEKPIESRVLEGMCRFISDGDEINIGGRVWQLIDGNGHSPEHICLFNSELNTLISGDQAIARISSNISVYPSNPNANPLKDWLMSCEKLRDTIESDTLVLAAHQEPFKGIKARMQNMIDDHHADLELLRVALVDKKSAVGARRIIFNRELDPIQIVLATTETLAFLNYLIANNEVSKSKNSEVVYYQILAN